MNLETLEPIDKDDNILTIIETPKGHRNKYKHHPEYETFEANGVMPAGAVFPYDFGFIPSTLGEDGDPLNVLVLMDEPTYFGCLVRVNLIGVIKAQQRSKDEDNRNDRLIAVHNRSHLFKDIDDIGHLPSQVLEEIAHFFVSYNRIKGVEFELLGNEGAKSARKLLDEAIQRKKQK